MHFVFLYISFFEEKIMMIDVLDMPKYMKVNETDIDIYIYS